jgi:V/A-type H+-transporting ATPase subunit D
VITSAGRSRLLELRRELATARDGRALLDRKREALLRAANDRQPRMHALRASVAAALASARHQLVDAQLRMGRSAVDAAAFAQPAGPVLSEREASVVGVTVPSLTMQVEPFRPRYGPATGSDPLDAAGAAAAAAIPDVVALAAAETGMRRIRRALARTVRRINALDAVVLPELAREIRTVASALEEEDRDEAVRRDRWRSRAREGVLHTQ